MEDAEEQDKILLPHHVQQELCDTRLRYRQGRKLTAVKVYSIATESNHLLVFGVPAVKLRREAKMLFLRFGKLLQFNISTEHAAEAFTETYHVQYQEIQSARTAKRVLDTKNFYGGSLHVCYAPEFESVTETYRKIMKRKNDVLRRLRILQQEDEKAEKSIEDSESNNYPIPIINVSEEKSNKNLLNMGQENVINIGNTVKMRKRKINSSVVTEKKFKPCFVGKSSNDSGNDKKVTENEKAVSSNVKQSLTDVAEVEIVDCTSVDKTTISNINEALNYNRFGNEVVIQLPDKPVNKIKFTVNKNSLIYPMFYFKTFIKLFKIQLFQ